MRKKVPKLNLDGAAVSARKWKFEKKCCFYIESKQQKKDGICKSKSKWRGLKVKDGRFGKVRKIDIKIL